MEWLAVTSCKRLVVRMGVGEDAPQHKYRWQGCNQHCACQTQSIQAAHESKNKHCRHQRATSEYQPSLAKLCCKQMRKAWLTSVILKLALDPTPLLARSWLAWLLGKNCLCGRWPGIGIDTHAITEREERNDGADNRRCKPQ